jgi:hypothetical protein
MQLGGLLACRGGWPGPAMRIVIPATPIPGRNIDALPYCQ